MNTLIKKYSWVVFVLFFIGVVIDIRVGAIGSLCMVLPPLWSVVTGKNKFCAGYCPRGSFLQQFTQHISRKSKIPNFFHSNLGKSVVVLYFLISISVAMSKVAINAESIGLILVRMLIISTFAAVVFGALFQPRTWCTVCPVGIGVRVGNKYSLQKLSPKYGNILTNLLFAVLLALFYLDKLTNFVH